MDFWFCADDADFLEDRCLGLGRAVFEYDAVSKARPDVDTGDIGGAAWSGRATAYCSASLTTAGSRPLGWEQDDRNGGLRQPSTRTSADCDRLAMFRLVPVVA